MSEQDKKKTACQRQIVKRPWFLNETKRVPRDCGGRSPEGRILTWMARRMEWERKIKRQVNALWKIAFSLALSRRTLSSSWSRECFEAQFSLLVHHTFSVAVPGENSNWFGVKPVMTRSRGRSALCNSLENEISALPISQHIQARARAARCTSKSNIACAWTRFVNCSSSLKGFQGFLQFSRTNYLLSFLIHWMTL